MMSEPIRIFGYHGTSEEKANSILIDGFLASDNDYDWLGKGVYFFQDAPVRAMQWAIQQHSPNPAVICSVIRLDNCIDLLDVKWFPPLKNLYSSFREQYRIANLPLPQQNSIRSKAHRLDCEFFNYTTQMLRDRGQDIEAIRAVFVEGEPIFPNSAIFDLAHIQIAVRNIDLIEDSHLITIEGVI